MINRIPVWGKLLYSFRKNYRRMKMKKKKMYHKIKTLKRHNVINLRI